VRIRDAVLIVRRDESMSKLKLFTRRAGAAGRHDARLGTQSTSAMSPATASVPCPKRATPLSRPDANLKQAGSESGS
jgi:hypothetical protein